MSRPRDLPTTIARSSQKLRKKSNLVQNDNGASKPLLESDLSSLLPFKDRIVRCDNDVDSKCHIAINGRGDSDLLFLTTITCVIDIHMLRPFGFPVISF